MFFDELATGLNFVAHEDAEEVVGGAGVFHTDLHQRAVGGIERRLAQFLGVHFAEALEAGDLQALLAGSADGRQQAAEIFQAGYQLAAAKPVARLLDAGVFAGSGCRSRSPCRARRQLVVDRADLVQFDDVQLDVRFDGPGALAVPSSARSNSSPPSAPVRPRRRRSARAW